MNKELKDWFEYNHRYIENYMNYETKKTEIKEVVKKFLIWFKRYFKAKRDFDRDPRKIENDFNFPNKYL
jgi:ribosomal protein S17E